MVERMHQKGTADAIEVRDDLPVPSTCLSSTRTYVNTTSPPKNVGRDPLPVVIFGIGIGLFVLFLVTVAIGINNENDFVREAWRPYRLLSHGHVVGFIRSGPGYVGSLILRAPFALVAQLFGAGWHGTYIVTAVPCVIASALLAGWLSSARLVRPRKRGARARERHIWPLDVFMLAPPAWLCINGGHPEEILGATLCIAAVVLAQRGSTRAAGVMLGLAVINKSWAFVAAPLVILLMPADRRLLGLVVSVAVAGIVLVPVELIRTSSSGGIGNALGGNAGPLFLVPQLWWFFGRSSWVAREAHYLLVLIAWAVTAVWWWLRVHRQSDRPTVDVALLMLALVFFLRASLDPWDNGYYFAPFMLSVMAYEDRRGFPWLSWAYAIMLLIFVPIDGVLKALGNNGQAAVFAVWALATIGFFAWRAFASGHQRERSLYATPEGSSA